MSEKRPHIIKAADQADHTFKFHHPLGGDTSEITMTMLSRGTALSRVGVSLGRVPPGKEAFVFHRHHAEEEWAFILEGKALSDIEGEQEEVGPGDFLAYPAGVGHNLKNIGDKDLVYLMGGEQVSVEIADFPRHGKRVLRAGDRLEFMDESAAETFVPDIKPAKPGDD
ncbi:MAG: cupin domain-containing protein [Hyphococcus sp.]